MFERFFAEARRVLVLAQDEARMLNHDYVGTEHLLLGLVHYDDGTAAQALESVGVTQEKVRSAVEKTIGRGERPVFGSIPHASAFNKALERALRQALQLGHKYIGTEHVLLGLIADTDDAGAKLLASLSGSNSEKLRADVLNYLVGHPSGEQEPEQVPGQPRGAIASVTATAVQRTPIADLPSEPITTSIRLTAEQLKLITAAAIKAKIGIDVWIKERLLTAARAEISDK